MQISAACIPIHTFGLPASCELKKVCDKYFIEVVEDAAEALGSSLDNLHLGGGSKFSIFSFNGNKIITTGGGGMLVTNDQALAKKARHLSTTGKLFHEYEYIHDCVATIIDCPI